MAGAVEAHARTSFKGHPCFQRAVGLPDGSRRRRPCGPRFRPVVRGRARRCGRERIGAESPMSTPWLFFALRCLIVTVSACRGCGYGVRIFGTGGRDLRRGAAFGALMGACHEALAEPAGALAALRPARGGLKGAPRVPARQRARHTSKCCFPRCFCHCRPRVVPRLGAVAGPAGGDEIPRRAAQRDPVRDPARGCASTDAADRVFDGRNGAGCGPGWGCPAAAPTPPPRGTRAWS